jgi:hypothetical protein
MSSVRVSSLSPSLSGPLSEMTLSEMTLARERLLPVHQTLAPLFGLNADDPTPLALTRGHTVACVGSAAMSCALAVLVAPTRSGSWAGVVGLPSCGVQAAADLGVALERTVFVADPTGGSRTSGQQGDATAALSALVDGVDVLLLGQRVVSSLSTSLLRRLQTRVQSRGGVLVVVGEAKSLASSLSADVRLTATTQQWQGVGLGYGHLQRRQVLLQLDGRRRARTTEQQVWLPDHQGQLSPVEKAAENTGVVIPLRRVG